MNYIVALFVITFFGAANCGFLGLFGGKEYGGSYGGSYSYGGGHGGLSSIAFGSANDAHSAVANQHAAAQKASFLAKAALAQKAVQAAGTAQAALAGKRVLLETLETLRIQAQGDLQDELTQLQSAKNAASTASNAAQQAVRHAEVSRDSALQAKQIASQVTAAANHLSQNLSSQAKMVEKAKTRLIELEHQLEVVREDFHQTQAAAHRAADLADKAKQNAAAAASSHGSGHSYYH